MYSEVTPYNTIDLKYQKGSEMHTSNTLSRLQNIADTPDNKDVIPLNFLQHLTPIYIEHTYLHLVENFYVHNTKSIDTTQVKRKPGRPPKPKLEKNVRETSRFQLKKHNSCNQSHCMTLLNN